MFNVAVFSIKDLIKYFVGIIVTLILIVFITRYVGYTRHKETSSINIGSKIQAITQKSYASVLGDELPGNSEVKVNNNDLEIDDEGEKTDGLMEKLLQVELAKIETKEDVVSKQDDAENPNIDVEAVEEKEAVQEAQANVETEVVTPEPIDAMPTDIYDNVQIRNQTGYVLSNEILVPDIEVDASNVIVFHTHTCESYTPTEENMYEASGNYRTIDLNYSVARVGDELENSLANYGYNVVHDKTYHDYPAYTGSYARSLETVENLLKANPSDVVIDLHRDAIGSNSNYAPTVKIGEDYCAQLMFVIGSNGGGLWHPNWNQNLKFAVKVQQKAEELYPGLFKPIILRNSRYNQQVAKAACIIEVGATGNTLEQCLCSMKYLAKVYDEAFK